MFGYRRAEFLREQWQSRIVFIGNNLLPGPWDACGRLGTNLLRERPPSWMTLGRVTPFRFCSVAVIATTFRGLAGDRRGTSASRKGASPGPERWEPTVSAINSWSWPSWSGENWEPGVGEGCRWPAEQEGGLRIHRNARILGWGWQVRSEYWLRCGIVGMFVFEDALGQARPRTHGHETFVPKLKGSTNCLAEHWDVLAWVISDP